MRIILLCVVIPYLFSFMPIGSIIKNEPPFILIKSGDGMELSERWIKMDDGTDSREVRVTIKIKAPVEHIFDVLKDEKSGKKWNNNALEYRIKETGDQAWISYIKYSFPFPLSDRECYMINKQVWEKDGRTIFFRSYDSRVFSNGKASEQMSGLEGKWVAKFEGDCTTLSYHIVSVPDSSLPRRLVDPIIRKNLWSSIEKLREIIEQ